MPDACCCRVLLAAPAACLRAVRAACVALLAPTLTKYQMVISVSLSVSLSVSVSVSVCLSLCLCLSLSLSLSLSQYGGGGIPVDAFFGTLRDTLSGKDKLYTGAASGAEADALLAEAGPTGSSSLSLSFSVSLSLCLSVSLSLCLSFSLSDSLSLSL